MLDQWVDRKHVRRKMLKLKLPNWKIIVRNRTKWKGVVEKTKSVLEL
jgi:hypothetical protein